MTSQNLIVLPTNPEKSHVRATTARYIKLGEGGCWEDLCLSDGSLRLAYYASAHEDARAHDVPALKRTYEKLGKITASSHARQILAFYDPSPDVVWFTFIHGYVWWAKAEPDVEYIGNDRELYPNGSRLRRCINGWSNRSISGKLLHMTRMHGELTKTAGYQQTICDIKPHMTEYLLRRINDIPLPEMVKAERAVRDLSHALAGLISMLHWHDFELLTDLVFSYSGWQRVTVVGEKLKTLDMELVQPISGKRAMVQVKSKTDQAQLDAYAKAFSKWDIDQLFYVYHSTDDAKPLSIQNSRITLIDVEEMASLVMRAGLAQWVMDKVG